MIFHFHGHFVVSARSGSANLSINLGCERYLLVEELPHTLSFVRRVHTASITLDNNHLVHFKPRAEITAEGWPSQFCRVPYLFRRAILCFLWNDHYIASGVYL